MKAVARYCGAFRTATANQVDIQIRGEMGPPRSHVWTVATATVRPLCIGEFTTATNRWSIPVPSFDLLKQAYPQLTVTRENLEAEVNRRQ